MSSECVYVLFTYSLLRLSLCAIHSLFEVSSLDQRDDYILLLVRFVLFSLFLSSAASICHELNNMVSGFIVILRSHNI